MSGSLFSHPLARGVDLSNPRAIFLQRRIFQEKPFLRQIYQEWYQSLALALPAGPEAVLEIGSGAGFIQAYIPDIITSEITAGPGIALALDATRLPFLESSLRGIVMTGVLHHLSRPRNFLMEAARCVKPGGVVAMIEPWVSSWSRPVWRWLHHEPFLPEAVEWGFDARGPLPAANSALPWIIFARDRRRFQKTFPQWQVQSVRPLMPFRYLAAGGLSHRNLIPGFAFSLVSRLERRLEPKMDKLAMFAEIILVRKLTVD